MNRRTVTVCLLLALLPTLSAAQLNVSIVSFDAGVPSDYSLHQDLRVFPKIREIEAQFLPFVLRQVLVDSGSFGAVRVVPRLDEAAELSITGVIAQSDGETLAISLRAVDARGQEWISKTYSTTDHYESVYAAFVADLATMQASLDDRTLRGIVGLSLMRYAASLVPDAYSGYFAAQPDGTYALLRLPAADDPMMARINRVRSVEYVMTDSIDQQYRELHEEVDSVYEIWRSYRHWYTNFRTAEAQRNELARSDAASGSYEAMRHAYDNYRLDRLAAQEQDRWIVGFNNEVAPAIEKMQARIAEMNNWVESGYVEWTRILGELFEIESGLAQ